MSALSIGHFILAGIALFSGIPALVWGVAGAKLIDQIGGDLALSMGSTTGPTGSASLGGNPDALLQDVGTLLVTAIVAGLTIAVLSAIHLAVAGVKIRQRRWWTFCYLTAWAECLMFPFGTIVGVFAIVVLGRPSVKRSFGVRSGHLD